MRHGTDPASTSNHPCAMLRLVCIGQFVRQQMLLQIMEQYRHIIDECLSDVSGMFNVLQHRCCPRCLMRVDVAGRMSLVPPRLASHTPHASSRIPMHADDLDISGHARPAPCGQFSMRELEKLALRFVAPRAARTSTTVLAPSSSLTTSLSSSLSLSLGPAPAPAPAAPSSSLYAAASALVPASGAAIAGKASLPRVTPCLPKISCQSCSQDVGLDYLVHIPSIAPSHGLVPTTHGAGMHNLAPYTNGGKRFPRRAVMKLGQVDHDDEHDEVVKLRGIVTFLLEDLMMRGSVDFKSLRSSVCRVGLAELRHDQHDQAGYVVHMLGSGSFIRMPVQDEIVVFTASHLFDHGVIAKWKHAEANTRLLVGTESHWIAACASPHCVQRSPEPQRPQRLSAEQRRAGSHEPERLSDWCFLCPGWVLSEPMPFMQERSMYVTGFFDNMRRLPRTWDELRHGVKGRAQVNPDVGQLGLCGSSARDGDVLDIGGVLSSSTAAAAGAAAGAATGAAAGAPAGASASPSPAAVTAAASSSTLSSSPPPPNPPITATRAVPATADSTMFPFRPLPLHAQTIVQEMFVRLLGFPRSRDFCVSCGRVTQPNTNGLIVVEAYSERGGSGGPLVDANGCLIGALSSGYEGWRVSRAQPVLTALGEWYAMRRLYGEAVWLQL